MSAKERDAMYSDILTDVEIDDDLPDPAALRKKVVESGDARKDKFERKDSENDATSEQETAADSSVRKTQQEEPETDKEPTATRQGKWDSQVSSILGTDDDRLLIAGYVENTKNGYTINLRMSPDLMEMYDSLISPNSNKNKALNKLITIGLLEVQRLKNEKKISS